MSYGSFVYRLRVVIDWGKAENNWSFSLDTKNASAREYRL